MNNQNQGNQYRNHEDAYQMLLSGQVGGRQQNQTAQQRWDFYNNAPTGGTPQSQIYGASSQSNFYGGQQSQSNYGMNQSQQSYNQGGNYQQVGGIQMPTQQAFQAAYMNRYPKVYGQPVVAVKKSDRGNVVAFKLANGHILDYPRILQASIDGALEGLVVQDNREGEPIVRSAPDAFEGNNLDRLPEFH